VREILQKYKSHLCQASYHVQKSKKNLPELNMALNLLKLHFPHKLFKIERILLMLLIQHYALLGIYVLLIISNSSNAREKPFSNSSVKMFVNCLSVLYF